MLEISTRSVISARAMAMLRMHEHAHAADMPLPAALMLVQRGAAHDLVIHHREQRQIHVEVYVFAPFLDDGEVGDMVLDEEAFLRRDGQEEFVEDDLVVLLQRAQLALLLRLQFDFLGVFLEGEFKRHGCSWLR
jgi:hypothetical protein